MSIRRSFSYTVMSCIINALSLKTRTRAKQGKRSKEEREGGIRKSLSSFRTRKFQLRESRWYAGILRRPNIDITVSTKPRQTSDRSSWDLRNSAAAGLTAFTSTPYLRPRLATCFGQQSRDIFLHELINEWFRARYNNDCDARDCDLTIALARRNSGIYPARESVKC